jgi:type II secretory pathway pseudopilin PulG
MFKVISKRGAMFGLDARIALAIFASLSVISGVALYKSIQKSMATAALVTFENINKAIESYYIDTGTLPVLYTVEIYTKDLIEDPGVTGWKGPYAEIHYVNSNRFYTGVLGKSVEINALRKRDSRTTFANNGNYPISFGGEYYLYLSAGSFPPSYYSYAIELDKMIDQGDGLLAGKIQGWQAANATAEFDHSMNFYLFYRTNFIYK